MDTPHLPNRDRFRGVRIVWFAAAASVMLAVRPTDSRAFGQARFWLSTAEAIPPGSSAPSDSDQLPDISVARGATARALGVWGRPDATKVLTNLSLNLVASQPEIISFTSATLHNGELPDGRPRFEFRFDSQTGLDLTNQTPCFLDEDPAEVAVWGMKGFTLEPTNAHGIGDATAAQDVLYDPAHDAWLLATITYDAVTLGEVELFLQIGEIGINHFGEETGETLVSFGIPTDDLLEAKADRCRNSDTAEALVRVVEPLPGDFNLNQLLDTNDIDLLSGEVLAGSNSSYYDLDANLLVNQMDREIWVENLAGTFFGDADLDGQVVFSDFVALANHFGQAGGWAEGDFDGDQTVTFADFVLPALTFGESKASQPVPEPISGRLLWWSAFVVLLHRPVRGGRGAKKIANQGKCGQAASMTSISRG